MNQKEFRKYLGDWFQFRPEAELEGINPAPILKIMEKSIGDAYKYNEKQLKNFIDDMPSFNSCKDQEEVEKFVSGYMEKCKAAKSQVTTDNLNLYVEKLQKIHFRSYKDWATIAGNLIELIQKRSEGCVGELKDNFLFSLDIQLKDTDLNLVYEGQ